MSTNLSTVSIVLGLTLLTGAALSWLFGMPSSNATPTHNARELVTYAEQNSQAQGPLLPHVVTTATKLGQGRRAVSGLPTANPFEHPDVRVSEAGSALLIPGSALPGSHWNRHISSLPPLTSGSEPLIKYDIYSWSMGTLVATTPAWIDLAEPNNAELLPAELASHANALEHSSRLMLVLPPNSISSSQATQALNRFDAYIVVADVLVPAV